MYRTHLPKRINSCSEARSEAPSLQCLSHVRRTEIRNAQFIRLSLCTFFQSEVNIGKGDLTRVNRLRPIVSYRRHRKRVASAWLCKWMLTLADACTRRSPCRTATGRPFGGPDATPDSTHTCKAALWISPCTNKLW